MISIFATATVTGASTLSVNAGSAIPIKKIIPTGLTDTQSGDWGPGFPLVLLYDGTEWINLVSLYAAPQVSQSTGFTVGIGNLYEEIVATTGITVTLPAATSLPNYFFCYLNANGGAITVTPNGTDNIQGANANFTIPQHTSGRLYTDASSNWYLDGTCVGPIPASVGGTGVNNGSSTITLGGNLTTSGANNLTLTTTGATNVTLPTSGTLVNTGVTSLSSLSTVGTIGTGIWQGTVIGSTYGGTGVNNGSSTITLGGNLTLSGAFTTTLTVTDRKSVV